MLMSPRRSVSVYLCCLLIPSCAFFCSLCSWTDLPVFAFLVVRRSAPPYLTSNIVLVIGPSIHHPPQIHLRRFLQRSPQKRRYWPFLKRWWYLSCIYYIIPYMDFNIPFWLINNICSALKWLSELNWNRYWHENGFVEGYLLSTIYRKSLGKKNRKHLFKKQNSCSFCFSRRTWTWMKKKRPHWETRTSTQREKWLPSIFSLPLKL